MFLGKKFWGIGLESAPGIPIIHYLGMSVAHNCGVVSSA